MVVIKSKKKSGGDTNKLTHGIKRVKGENFYRDAKKAARVKMLAGGKPVRDRGGNIVEAAAFQKGEKDAPAGRIQPDRRWFGAPMLLPYLDGRANVETVGNTRVISQDALEHFRTAMSARKSDPYSVLLKRNKLPMSLLDDTSAGQKRSHIVETEPFQDTFGPKAQRKRPRVDVGTFEELSAASREAGDAHDAKAEAQEVARAKQAETSVADGGGFLGSSYAAGPAPGPSKPRGWTAHGAMSAVQKSYDPIPEPVFKKGGSRRIYGELYKVIDSSDVIIHVLDARDPMGTLCQNVIEYVRKEKSHKQVVYLINKVDLVPGWVTQRYISHLTSQAPTIAFHASQTHPFGKGALIQLLRQFSQLHSDRKQISVGFVGYPNVGKSSIINCLKAGRVCNVAPIPGETKVWQYITLTRRIYLIDCPGIVPASAQDSQTSKVLKGVVRVEHLAIPSEHIPALLERVRPIYLERAYGLQGVPEPPPKPATSEGETSAPRWSSDAFLDAVARRYGRLLKGGEPDRETVAKMVLNDWIRGNIPYFVRPPDSANFLKKQGEDVFTTEGSAVVATQETEAMEVAQEEAPAAPATAENAPQSVSGGRDEPPAKMDGANDEWNGVVGNGDNGGAIEAWSDSEGGESDDASDEGADDSSGSEIDEKASKSTKTRERRSLFVQQDFRGIITRPKFLKDDRFDNDDDDAVDENDDIAEAVDVDAPLEEENAEEEVQWDDVMQAVAEPALETSPSSNPEQAQPSEKLRGKAKAQEPGEEDEGRHRRPKTTKDPRMKTNKRKATNFYTFANVKNRNKEKKQKAVVVVEERGKHGNRKAGGKGGKRR
ncbi:GTPase required for pre-60S ribosomal subunit nuclear export and maturation [Tulasnella sp. 403]|nr:GTPase required for pre-60S ribosomal subunit nuclear export and maturation [Tulasnella sp. 403]